MVYNDFNHLLGLRQHEDGKPMKLERYVEPYDISGLVEAAGRESLTVEKLDEITKELERLGASGEHCNLSSNPIFAGEIVKLPPSKESDKMYWAGGVERLKPTTVSNARAYEVTIQDDKGDQSTHTIIAMSSRHASQIVLNTMLIAQKIVKVEPLPNLDDVYAAPPVEKKDDTLLGRIRRQSLEEVREKFYGTMVDMTTPLPSTKQKYQVTVLLPDYNQYNEVVIAESGSEAEDVAKCIAGALRVEAEAYSVRELKSGDSGEMTGEIDAPRAFHSKHAIENLSTYDIANFNFDMRERYANVMENRGELPTRDDDGQVPQYQKDGPF